MKNTLYLIVLLFPFLVLGQSDNQNYVKTFIYKGPTINHVTTPTTESITYLDGLGRPIQQIAKAQSVNGTDIITHIEYDSFGRQLIDYLPFASGQNTMEYMEGHSLKQQLKTQYETIFLDTHPYSEKLLEPSPLGRVLEQSAPGSDWRIDHPEKHTIRFDYKTNVAADKVKLYTAIATWNSTLALFDIALTNSNVNGSIYYGVNELYKTITKDENWKNTDNLNNTTVEFKDKEGHLVLKRNYNASEPHDTYYVYDQFGNLSYVIPPKASNPTDLNVLNGLCYQYKYDSRNRLVEKKLPGKDIWDYIVYDVLDRVVATGPVPSPFGISENGWMVTRYDTFNRAVLTGWYSSTINSMARKILQFSNNSVVSPLLKGSSTIDNIAVGYATASFPAVFKLLTVNYFDDYSFPDAPTTFNSGTENGVYYNNTDKKPRGLATGSWIRVLDNASTAVGEKSYVLYDNKARPIKSYSTNHLNGYSITETKFDFIGKPLYTTTKHRKDNISQALIIVEEFTYSDQDRLLTHTHKVNDEQVELLAHNEYDEIGQLIRKSVGGTDLSGVASLQKVDYKYNIRGWLKGINDVDELTVLGDPTDLFAFKINYNEIEHDFGGEVEALFNGNISQTFWKSDNDNVKRSYGYQYDDLNRLLKGIYQRGSLVTHSYDEILNYDKNGNIITLNRNGYYDNENVVPPYRIDELYYDYRAHSNKLQYVHDQTNSTDGFKDGNMFGNDYEYDGYGNMIQDKNKNITKIYYNHLNLPVKIEFGNAEQNEIKYLYNAVGSKVSKTVTSTSQATGTEVNTTVYLGGFQYKNNVLQFFPTLEGYVSVTDESRFDYVYNYLDHLGNVRLSYTLEEGQEELKILEENHYYPFGLKHSYNTNRRSYSKSDNGAGSVTRPVARSNYQYKYNGKEFQDELGLNFYDYGARGYMPDLGRWTTMDNLSELYFSNSSYVYALNTPVQAIDPDGNVVIFINGQHTGDGAKGYQDGSNWNGSNNYWRNFDTSKSNWLSKPNKIAFDQLVKNHLGDQNAMYRDGSMGGFNNTLWETNTSKINLSSANRINAGYEQGQKDASMIIANLARDKTTGEIVETIKIITHSMGGAYGKGYVKALKEYIKTLPKEQQRQVKITLVADFDPFQAGSLNADPNVFTQQFTHLGGLFGLAEDRQGGLSDENYYESKGDHSIFTFLGNINDLQEGTYKWNGTEWICTTCKK